MTSSWGSSFDSWSSDWSTDWSSGASDDFASFAYDAGDDGSSWDDPVSDWSFSSGDWFSSSDDGSSGTSGLDFDNWDTGSWDSGSLDWGASGNGGSNLDLSYALSDFSFSSTSLSGSLFDADSLFTKTDEAASPFTWPETSHGLDLFASNEVAGTASFSGLGGLSLIGNDLDLSLPQTPSREVTVKKGDTLWSIAGGDATRIGQIMAENNLKDSWIRPGQVLTVRDDEVDRGPERNAYQSIAQTVFDQDNARLASLGIAVPGGPPVTPRVLPAESVRQAEPTLADLIEPELAFPAHLHDLTSARPAIDAAPPRPVQPAAPAAPVIYDDVPKPGQSPAPQVAGQASPPAETIVVPAETEAGITKFLSDVADLGMPIAYGFGATFSPALASTSVGQSIIGTARDMILPGSMGSAPPQWTTRLGGGFFALSESPLIYNADTTGFWTYPPRSLRPVNPATGAKGPIGGFSIAPVATWNTDTSDYELGAGVSKVFANGNALFFLNARSDVAFSTGNDVNVSFGVVFSANGMAGAVLDKAGKVAGKVPTLPSIIAKAALTGGEFALEKSKDYANVWYGPLWRGQARFDGNGNLQSLSVNHKTVDVDAIMKAADSIFPPAQAAPAVRHSETLDPEKFGP